MGDDRDFFELEPAVVVLGVVCGVALVFAIVKILGGLL